MDDLDLLADEDGPVLTVTFNRPRQFNAMTWAMHEGLYDVCQRADADDEIRVMVLRGAGDEAFVREGVAAFSAKRAVEWRGR